MENAPMTPLHRRVQLRFVAGHFDAFVPAPQLEAFLAAVEASTDPKASQLLVIIDLTDDDVDP
jgi:hypothetical protein